MHRQTRMNDSVHLFINELTSRIVAESGIPSDRFHLGKIILQSLKDAPEFVSQIDGATNQSETNKSVLERSVRCANSFRNLGLKRGEVMVLTAPNHLDMCIPYYAALYLGIIISPVDHTFTVLELQETFVNVKPKIVFCQREKIPDIQLALNKLNLETQIVTFDSNDTNSKNVCSFSELLDTHGNGSSVEEFRTADFEPEDTIAFVIPTSGTTGLPKHAALTHKNLAITGPYKWSRFKNFPTPTRLVLVTSPIQWISAIFQYNLSPIMRFTRLQSSVSATVEHLYYLINTYKPTYQVLSPNLLSKLVKSDTRDQCDFSCFEMMFVGGSAVSQKLIDEAKLCMKSEIFAAYGATEVSTFFVFHADSPPPGSVGKRTGLLDYRLINVDSGEDIVEPHAQGELWLKGPGVFKGYYNNPEATKETFAEDGWFKTGDVFYRDEEWNFYFVERIKMLLKYNNYQVSPVEIENVILQHPGVLDAAVTGVPDRVFGDMITACVVRRPGYAVTALEIKDLVKESLSDVKQLRGGVIFLDQIPMTPSTKINRRKVKEIAVQMNKE